VNQCVGAFDRQAVETLRNKPAVVLDGSFEFFALFTHKLTALGIGGSVQHSQSSMTAEDGAMMTLTILDISVPDRTYFSAVRATRTKLRLRVSGPRQADWRGPDQGERIAMQWGFDGKPTWHAPKQIGLWSMVALIPAVRTGRCSI
jgi:hypothetical protein